MNIKLEQYKIFAEAASTLSFSKAARNLFISQSAVSQTIKHLESELQSQLFIRKSKGVILTKEGKDLYTNIRQALDLITSSETNIMNNNELTTGQLVIGSSDTLSERYLLPYIMKYNEKYPNVDVKIINRTSLECNELLKSGHIELGFLNLPIKDDSLVINKCLEVHDIFVSNKKITNPLTLQQLSNERLALLENSSNTRKNIESYFHNHQCNLTPTFELGAHQLLLEVAKVGLAYSSVIKEFSSHELNKTVYEIPLTKPLPARNIGYAYLHNRHLSSASLKFIELIETI